MNSTNIIIGVFVVIIIVMGGVYGLTRKSATPDDYDSTIAPPSGPPDFPTPTTPTPSPTPSSTPTPTSQPTQVDTPNNDIDFLPTPTTPPEIEPITTPIPPPALGTETIVIEGSTDLIEINNILLNPEEVFEGYGVLVRRTSQYSFAYYHTDDSFAITLDDQDVVAARAAVEWDFLTILGISPEEACQLHVLLSVPKHPDFGGVNYGLSFCPNGVAF